MGRTFHARGGGERTKSSRNARMQCTKTSRNFGDRELSECTKQSRNTANSCTRSQRKRQIICTKLSRNARRSSTKTSRNRRSTRKESAWRASGAPRGGDRGKIMKSRTLLVWHNNGGQQFTFTAGPGTLTVSRTNSARESAGATVAGTRAKRKRGQKMGRPEGIPVSLSYVSGELRIPARRKRRAGSARRAGESVRCSLFEALLQGFDCAFELFEILQAGIQLAAGGLLVLAA